MISVKDFRYFSQTLPLSLIRLPHPTPSHLLMVICSVAVIRGRGHRARGACPSDICEAASPQVAGRPGCSLLPHTASLLGFMDFFIYSRLQSPRGSAAPAWGGGPLVVLIYLPNIRSCLTLSHSGVRSPSCHTATPGAHTASPRLSGRRGLSRAGLAQGSPPRVKSTLAECPR